MFFYYYGQYTIAPMSHSVVPKKAVELTRKMFLTCILLIISIFNQQISNN